MTRRAVTALLLAFTLALTLAGSAFAAGPFTAGDLVQVQGRPEIWRVDEAGQRRWIADLGTFTRLRASWDRLQHVDQPTLDALPVGPAHLSHPMARDVVSGRVYVHDGAEKRWISNLPTFSGLGLSWGRVVDSEPHRWPLTLPDGPALDLTRPAPPPGAHRVDGVSPHDDPRVTAALRLLHTTPTGQHLLSRPGAQTVRITVGGDKAVYSIPNHAISISLEIFDAEPLWVEAALLGHELYHATHRHYERTPEGCLAEEVDAERIEAVIWDELGQPEPTTVSGEWLAYQWRRLQDGTFRELVAETYGYAATCESNF